VVETNWCKTFRLNHLSVFILTHFTIFTKLVMPLSIPALASFAIFQFLWVWNDLLVSLVFLGGTPDVAPITVRVAELSRMRGFDFAIVNDDLPTAQAQLLNLMQILEQGQLRVAENVDRLLSEAGGVS